MKRLAFALTLLASPAAADTPSADWKAERDVQNIGFFLAIVDRLADRCGLDAAAVATAKESRRARAIELASAERLRQAEEKERANTTGASADAALARMDCKFIREAVAAK